MSQEKLQHQHFDLLIRPEPGDGFHVSLWATRGIGLNQAVYVAPPESWLTYSRLLEDVHLLDARSLGAADASISRGEAIVQPIQCSPQILARVGLREQLEAMRKGLALSALFRRDDEAGEAEEPGVTEIGLHPRFRLQSGRNALEAGTAADKEGPRLALTAPAGHDAAFAAGEPEALSLRSSFALLGVRVENLTMPETIAWLDRLIEQGGFHQIATANVDFLTKAFEDRELLQILHHCELVLPDGMPLVWAAKMMGVPLRSRVTGADMVPQLFALSEQKGRRIFLLGATEERSNAAMERLRRDYPAANICGRYSPPFAPLESMDDEDILRRIEEARPDILLVAFGNPKQEKWVFRNRARLNVPVCIGVGASLDFFSGMQSRAPIWMQRTGMEWIHRMLSEPKRLAKRYLSDALFISRYLSVQLLASGLQVSSAARAEVKWKQYGAVPVLTVVGDFSLKAAGAALEEMARRTLNHSVVIDLTATSSISPDATGLLMQLAQVCMNQGKELWIAGLKGSLRSALRATFPAGEPFHTAHRLEDALRFVTPA